MDIELTRIFVKVIQNGSFTKAALAMNLPKSTVSKAVARLEFETKTKLLLRTTRSLTLTAAGRAFFEATLGPLQAIEDAQKSLHGQDSILTGLLRITAPEDLGMQLIAPAVAELALNNPGLSFDLHYTDEIVDLVRDGFDLAVRIGRPRESRFKYKKAGEILLVLVASPSFLKSRERIRSLDDLANIETLSLRSLAGPWTLRTSTKSSKVNIRPRIVSNQMSSVLRAAAAGFGVALVPEYLCRPEIEAGRLVRVLPDWRSHGLPVSLITPLAPSSSARLRITTDRIFEALKTALTQE